MTQFKLTQTKQIPKFIANSKSENRNNKYFFGAHYPMFGHLKSEISEHLDSHKFDNFSDFS
jgi:hypothetical protein